MAKQKICISFTDENGAASEKEWEVDVGSLENIHKAENKVIGIEKDIGAFLLTEVVKKKKKWRWRLFYVKILALFGMGPLSSRSSAKHLSESSKGKSSAGNGTEKRKP